MKVPIVSNGPRNANNLRTGAIRITLFSEFCTRHTKAVATRVTRV